MLAMRLGELVRDLRVDRDYNPREIISTWTGEDPLDGKVVDAWVIIFRTRGCYWAHTSGCSMCGYVNDTAVDVSEADLLHQLASVLPAPQAAPGHAAGGPVKTYLLVKPPLLTEREAIEDAVRSGHEADPHSDTISFNPVNVQRDPLVAPMFKRRGYPPP